MNSDPKLHYGFLDESGILEKKATSGNYFIISVVVVGNPAELGRVMKRARYRARGRFKAHSVFKASKESAGFIKIVLEEIAKRDVQIIADVWDKRKKHFDGDKNQLYAHLLAETTADTLALHPKLDVVVHKRYASPRIRDLVTRAMSEIAGSGHFLSVSHRSETECRQLELADAVAWAIFQKYNNRDETFYRIIERAIKKENRLAA
ncbi:MAG: DUF3800 domain-containing protein [Parcubacteria group bacterium]|nr:DUF3800 domain-containing protein [Parcubacteria group bacterium]